MSLKKQVQRNQAKTDKDTLKQYEPFLKKGWQSRPMEDINLLAGFARNGITIADLTREVAKARKQAYEDTVTSVMKVMYAAVAVVLVDEFGFSKDDCLRAIGAIDNKMAITIDSDEIVEEMHEKAGLRINAKEGVERVEQI